MKSFVFIIGLSVFGFVISMLNLTGIWPELNLPMWIFPTVTETTVLDTQSGMLETAAYLATTYAGTGINVVLTMLSSVLFIGILLVYVVVPPVFAAGFQGLVLIVYIWDFVNWYFNKSKM